MEALRDPEAQLPDVHAPAAPLYQHQLALLQSQHPRVRPPGIGMVPWMMGGLVLLGLGFFLCCCFSGEAGTGGGGYWGFSVSACPVQGELAQEELFVAVEMLSAVALVNQALDARNPHMLWSSLASPALGLSGVEDANAQR